MNFINSLGQKASGAIDSAKETAGEVSANVGKVKTSVGNAIDELPGDIPGLIRKIEELKDEKLRMLEEWKEEKKREFRMLIQSKLERLYDHAMNVVSDHLKDGMKDPDMPDCVANFIDELVDSIWPDVKIEVKDKLLTGLGPTQLLEHGDPPSCCTWLPAKIRYVLFPYDKSIWGQMKNPFWWLFLLASLVPRYGIGQISYIIIFFFLDCSDEFQLFQYIINFKALQFVTLGVLSAVIGAVQYYICTTTVPMSCEDYAPMEELWSIAIFFIQVVMVWIAFILMAYSKKKGGAHYLLTQEAKAAQMRTVHTAEQRKAALERISTTDEILTTMAVENEEELKNRTRARMRGYLIYDLLCFLLCLGLGLWMAFGNLMDSSANVDIHDADTIKKDNWKFVMSLYWIKALFGFLSFPFALLKIPVITSFLSHAKPTGYNPYGNTVPLLGRPENGPVPWDPTRPVREEV